MSAEILQGIQAVCEEKPRMLALKTCYTVGLQIKFLQKFLSFLVEFANFNIAQIQSGGAIISIG